MTRTPSPFSAGSSWGAAIEKNFFYFFWIHYQLVLIILRFWFYFFSFLLFDFYSYFIFYFFSDFRLDSCFDSVFQIILFNYFDSIKIRHLVLDFIFQTPYRLNSHTSFHSISTRLRFSYSLLIFDSHRFRLISALSILCFDSSTLYLFNFSACYKQTSMLIWVWFMLILAILRLSDVFSFVLGVVYRLWIK